MFNSLRSRLLLSYLAIIATILLVVTLALLAVSFSQTARVLPTLRVLSSITVGLRRELLNLIEGGAGLRAYESVLAEAAAAQDVRVVLLDRQNNRIVYDSQPDQSAWQAGSLERVRRPAGEFTELDPNLPIGRLTAPDSSRWLVFSQPLALRSGRLLLVAGRPEPRGLQIFREVFLQPLCQAGFLALLLAALLAVLVSRSVARPLQQMARAAESIAQGDLNQQLPVRGPSEVRQMAVSFNTMASQVAATREAQRNLVANVSHDLKTPLTAVLGWSQALLDGTAADPEQQQQAAAVIHQEAGRMERMVGQLLDLARIESGQLELTRLPVDLSELLAALHQSLALRAEEKQIQFTQDLQPVPVILGDADRLAQVVTNLIDNAFAHTPAGGRVHLNLQSQGPRAVEIAVQDTGLGIPATDLERIFDRFYQVDKSRARIDERSGSGLGLAIVKELVEAHGGRIIARSQVGQGSVFTVKLPVSDAPENLHEAQPE